MDQTGSGSWRVQCRGNGTYGGLLGVTGLMVHHRILTGGHRVCVRWGGGGWITERRACHMLKYDVLVSCVKGGMAESIH